MNNLILHIALPTPLRYLLDYLPPQNNHQQIIPGMRVRVPFQNREMIGIVISISNESNLPQNKLKPISAILDENAIIPNDLLQLGLWATQYYHHPIGEIFATLLPNALRTGKQLCRLQEEYWALTALGQDALNSEKFRSEKQKQLLQFISSLENGLSKQLSKIHKISNTQLKPLLNKNYIINKISEKSSSTFSQVMLAGPTLTSAQEIAVKNVINHLDKFQAFLLHGITGSGKTEVYFHLIENIIKNQKQALILIPEIALTPQTVARFQERFLVPIVILHSGLTDKEKLIAWQQAADNHAKIIIGTRSAIFAAIPNLGMIIVDEEHDPSYKQQDGFRYHARDLALVRAHQKNIPIVLGSATPSLETLNNVDQKRYQLLSLPERPGFSQLPTFQFIDIRNQALQEGLSKPLIHVMQNHLNKGGQILLFLNRRGFAPNWICHGCGWIAHCRRCDANLILHQSPSNLQCHHCGLTQQLMRDCPECKSQKLMPLGLGTERIESAIAKHFPNIGIVRIDKDTVKSKKSLNQKLETIHSGNHKILIGTQMLAKGHHFPDVTLVAIIDADSGFFSSDIRATEHIGQLLIQVAGRAGRAEKPGEVWLQTRHPEHPLLNTLFTHGYLAFSKVILKERKEMQFPPFGHLALLRAESLQREKIWRFLQEIKLDLTAILPNEIQLLGPAPALLEKKAGRFRAQLLIQSASRKLLHAFLHELLKNIDYRKDKYQIRWSLDVDPLDLC